MNGKTAKKIRKVVNGKIRNNMEDLYTTLSKENLYWRFIYAMRILFKLDPKKTKFEVKRNG